MRWFDVNYRLRLKDETYKWFRAAGHTIRDKDGKPLEIIGIFVNIDERVTQGRELGKFGLLGDKHLFKVIVHAGRNATIQDDQQFIDEFILQFGQLLIGFRIDTGKVFFVLGARLTVFLRSREQVLADDNALHGRTCLQRSVFHIACFVAEDGMQQFSL